MMPSRSSSGQCAPSCPPPRFHVASERAADLADEVIAFGEYAGIRIGDAPWKRDVLSDVTALDPAGRFVHHRSGLSGPRQMGKTWLGISFASVMALAGYKVLWTEHSYTTILEMFRRFKGVFGSKANDRAAPRPKLNARVRELSSATAGEKIVLKGDDPSDPQSGGGIWFSTRTKTTSLGFEFDIIIVDEAQELSKDEWQAIVPTTAGSSRHNVVFLYLGTPPRPGGHGDQFRLFRDDVLGDGRDPADSWNEWGVAEIGDVEDEERIRAVNPSIGFTADIDTVLTGIRALHNTLAAAQEYLGYWLPGVTDAVMPAEQWEQTTVPRRKAPGEGRIAYGVKFAPDGQTVALSVCCVPEEGVPHVELYEYAGTGAGLAPLVDWLAARWQRACAIVLDGRAGRIDLHDRLRARGVPEKAIVLPGAADVTSAASGLVNAVREHAVTHIAQEVLDGSAASSTRRPIGRDGGWGFGGDLSAPIESCAWALWGASHGKVDPEQEQEVNF